ADVHVDRAQDLVFAVPGREPADADLGGLRIDHSRPPIRRELQSRRTIARLLSTSKTTSKTTMAAAALLAKPCSGRDTQLKIWIGSTVNGASKPSGTKLTKARAPSTSSGAASPIARATERIAPVKMPGRAIGNTT